MKQLTGFPAIMLLCAGTSTAVLIPAPAQAQQVQGPRLGVAPTPPAPRTAMPIAIRPVTVVRRAVVVGSYPVTTFTPAAAQQTAANAAPRNTYLTGPGQWVPADAYAQAIALHSQPGDSAPSPAAASGHWDWQRVSMAELVEMSRRNRAAREK